MSGVSPSPTRKPTSTAGRSGRPRRYPSVMPFMRAHFALRRIELDDTYVLSRNGCDAPHQCLRDLRRAAHACHLG